MTKRNIWTDDEIDMMNKNYHLGILELSKIITNHTVLSIRKKGRQLGLRVNRDNIYYNIDLLKKIVVDSSSFAEVFRKLNKSKSGDSYKSITGFIKRNNINISHFDPWKKNKTYNKKDISEYLKEGSNINSSKLKDKLYNCKLKLRICEKCGQTEYWNNDKLSLILDHINGISNDNRLENLRILCPNCSATLETHCRGSVKLTKIKNQELLKEIEKNKNFGFSIKKIKSQRKQRKIQRPSYQKLLFELESSNYCEVGKKYNVSDNCIRKWIRMYEKYGAEF